MGLKTVGGVVVEGQHTDGGLEHISQKLDAFLQLHPETNFKLIFD